MEITAEISTVISQHEEAVNAVSEALGPYRRERADHAADGDPERELNQVTERYQQSSLLLTGLILEQLFVSSEGEETYTEGEENVGRFDEGATTQLTILIGIDARIAEQAGSLDEAQILAPNADVSYPRPLTPLELDDLGPPLADVCAPLFSELSQDAEELDHEADGLPPPQPPAGASDGPDIKGFFDAVLVRAGDDIFGTIASSLSWLNRISAILRDPTASFISWSNDALKQGMSALQRLASSAWRQVLTKVLALAGEHAAQIGALGADLVRNIKEAHQLAARGTGVLLGKALNIKKVRAEAQTLVNGCPNRAGAALAACQAADKHHKKRRRPVPWLNKALPMCRLIPAYGVGVEAVAAATLLIYSIWLAHDHLDSPVLAKLRLPKNPGMLTEIKAAVR